MAIQHNPTYSNVYNNRGLCLSDLNRLDEAIASYDMAIEHNPHHEQALNNRKSVVAKLRIP